MVLSAIIPEQWLYGFLSTAMTHNPFYGPALHAALFLGLTWLHWHRNDPPPLDIHVHITQHAVVWMGSLIGTLFVGFFRSPRFVDARIFDSRGVFRPWFFLFTIITIGLIAGVYRLEAGDLTLGIPFTVIFGIGLLALAIVGYVLRFLVPDGLEQIKYLVLFSTASLC